MKILLPLLIALGFQDPSIAGDFERLAGFDTVVVTEINRAMGTERLPAATGYAIEPGMYVTVSSGQMSIFDRVGATLNAGLATDRTGTADCKSGCPVVLYDAFRRSWMELRDEAASLATDPPSRVLMGVDAQLPARALLEASYAAAESRPGGPPALYLLLNGGRAGLRARPFFLLPPEGLWTSPGSNALALRVLAIGGDRFEVSSANGAIRRLEVGSSALLGEVLGDVAKRFPQKGAVIIDAGDGAYVYDLVAAMVAAQDHFERPVLALGQKIITG